MDEVYWIWMSLAMGAGAKLNQVIDFFGTPEEVYRSSLVELYLCPFLTPSQVERLDKGLIEEAKKIVELCESNGWKMVTPASNLYPEKLRQIPNYPMILYVTGEMIDFDNEMCVSVVGTRKASVSGVKAAYDVSYELAGSGTVIVSGGALGIDTAAHKGALAAGGKTVAVLGNGFGVSYLAQNEFLREMIAENGALITENAPFQKPTKFAFPIRNRIISALTSGTLVVETGKGSGSMLTANHALRQGRDLFVFTSGVVSVRNPELAKMLDNGKAHPIKSAGEILEYYGWDAGGRSESGDDKKHRAVRSGVVKQHIKTEGKDSPEEKVYGHIGERVSGIEKSSSCKKIEQGHLSAAALEIYNMISKAGEADADNIMASLDMDISTAMKALMELQLKQYIKSEFGNKYSVI